VVTAQGCGFLGTKGSTTGITLNTSGDNAPFDNRPAYFALAFIMKE
jgi:hypothetical protein